MSTRKENQYDDRIQSDSNTYISDKFGVGPVGLNPAGKWVQLDYYIK